MTRRFLAWLALAWTAQLTYSAPAALLQSKVLESNVTYLRVGDADANLATEISAAENALTVSNKTIGTVLDLRSAQGADSDAIKAVTDFFASEKTPLAILINGSTEGSAAQLAKDLHQAQAGLVFGEPTSSLQPDILVTVKPAEEKLFMANPYALPPTNNLNEEISSNFVPYVDHTSEADLVRAKIKDGDEDESTAPERRLPSRPIIHDPTLARAVDFLKAVATLQPTRA